MYLQMYKKCLNPDKLHERMIFISNMADYPNMFRNSILASSVLDRQALHPVSFIMWDATDEHVKDLGEWSQFALLFSCAGFHWLQSNLESHAILKSHRTVHVPIGCYFTFQIAHFLCCNLNANSLPATSLFVSANRLRLLLHIQSLICFQ